MTKPMRSAILACASFFIVPFAKADLAEIALQYPKGATETSIRYIFRNSQPTTISNMGVGESGIRYMGEIGRPTFYFCRGSLITIFVEIPNATMNNFRHLVEQNSRHLGEGKVYVEGQTDQLGEEWTAFSVDWKLPDQRIGELSLVQYEAASPFLHQIIMDHNKCRD